MSATYTNGSTAALDRVRRLIPDMTIEGIDPLGGVYVLADYHFTDEQIADFLADEGANVYGAAAAALESSLGDAAANAEIIHIPGHSVDTTGGIDTIRARVAWLRSQANGGAAVIGKSRSVLNTVVW